jgi:hypothetical protein
VRTPAFRERDYAACLPGDLAAAIDDLNATRLGPGRSGTAGLAGGPRRQHRQNAPEDDMFLGPQDARKESVRAALALLVDETAAGIVETVAPVTRESWLKPGKRTPGHDTATQPLLTFVVARDRVLSLSRSGIPRELPTGWPRSVTAVDWWQETVRPTVESLPGIRLTRSEGPRSKPAVKFTDEFEGHVRRGVLKAASNDPALAKVLGFADDPEAVRAAILGYDHEGDDGRCHDEKAQEQDQDATADADTEVASND